MPQALPMLAYYAASAAGASAGWAAFASFVVSAVVADYQKQSAADKARAQAARDRTVNIRSGVAPRKLVLGTARLGGAVMYGEFVGPELEYLDMITALHHGDAGALTEVLGAYFDDEFVPAADLVDGVPTSGKYSGGALLETSLTEVQTLTASATITLPYLPVGEVFAIHNLAPGATGEALSQVGLTVVSVVGYVVTLSEPITGEVWVTYRSNDNPWVPLRLQWTTGSSSQASTSWAGVDTPKWTADHRLRGVSYMRTLMRTEDRVFATGLPQPSLVARAANGVWDPRSSTYVNGTSNPALLAAWFRMLPKADGGFSVPTDWIDWASVATAANICDELISVRKLDGAGYENIKRYECNTVLNLELPAADNLRVILGAMAGDFPFTAGKYRCYAGAFRAATVTLTDDDVCGEMPINFAPSTGAASPPNVVTARIYNRAKAWVEDGVPAVVNDAYVAADDREEPMEIDLPACTDTRQANYLMGVRLEQMRPAMAGSLTVTGKGANLALIETVQLNLVGYEALAGRTFEIRRRTNHWNGRYTLELAEVKASTFTLDADRFTPPSTNTPGDTSELWNVTPVTLTSVVNATLTQSDGSHLDRALVTWAAHPQALVNPRGKIEVRYRAPGYEWVYAAPVPGDQTTTYIGPLGIGMVVFVEARAMNSLGVFSAWSGIDPFTVTGTNDVPPDVTGLSYEIKPGQVVVTWDDKPGLETELRYSAVPGAWALVSGATFLWAGIGTDYKHARPPNGTYRVWAAHRNRNFYSAAPQYVDITVDDSIDAGGAVGGRLQLTTDRGPYFLFADATIHASASPQIVFTCAMLNAAGDVTWAARAFDGSGTDIGAVALSGTDGLVRSMSAAQFVAPGSAGSVREVRVTVTHPTAGSDSVTVYRRDPTTTTPTIFLSNRQATVPADVNGLNGDYSDAETQVQVITGLTDETALYTTSIDPDPGMTANVNGGAGPVTTALVTVAVSDSTIDDGYVGVSCARTGYPTLTDAFRVSKAKGADGLRIYWDPRSEIVLPVDADGAVTSWADAWSALQIDRADGFSDVANWQWSAEFSNCVGTITGNRVDVTGLVALGVAGGADTTGTVPGGLGWNGVTGQAYDGESRWVATGVTVGSPAAHSKVIVTDDYQSWAARDVGLSAIWRHLRHSAASFVLVDEDFGHHVRRSIDGGENWVAGGAFVSAGQITGLWASDTTIIASTYAGSASQRSTNGGQSWAAFNLPGGVMTLYPCGPNEWLGRDTNGYTWRSIDDGVSWANISSQLPGTLWAAVRFKGRTFLSLWAATTKIGVIEAGSAVQLVSTGLSDANQGRFVIVEDVLYLQTGSGWIYTSDGLTWRASSLGVTSALALELPYAVRGAFIPLYLPGTATFVRRPLAATSDTDADVIVQATQAGKTPVRRVLPVRKASATRPLFAFGADPAQINLRATSDGYVTDYGPATCTAIIRRDGVPDLSSWAITWTATGMTPSSGSGATATFTGMTPGLARATLSYLATQPGYTDVRGDVPIVQLRDGQSSGYRQGAGFMVVDDQSNTYLGLRFTTDGWAQIKRGSGGSWVNYVPWSGAPGTPGIGGGTWLKVIPEVGAPALTSGTINTWLGLSSTREYIYQDASSGVHKWLASFLFSNSASGTDPLVGSGGLMLIVP